LHCLHEIDILSPISISYISLIRLRTKFQCNNKYINISCYEINVDDDDDEKNKQAIIFF